MDSPEWLVSFRTSVLLLFKLSPLDSLLTLEQARRSAIAAELTDIQLQRDRVRAWIALYKSLGGGWTAAQQEENTPGAAS